MGRAENRCARSQLRVGSFFCGTCRLCTCLPWWDGRQTTGCSARPVRWRRRRVLHRAAALSLKVNFEILDTPIRKAVVYLDPHEFHSTWLGNKAVYRTRMAMADSAELIILAPGVRKFGEDPAIDGLIRKYGYRGTPATLAAVSANGDLAGDLSAAAHLIHGSSEGRFTIRWCPGHLSQEEVEGVGYEYGDLKTALASYNPQRLHHGYNRVEGEEVFFIPNPGLGCGLTAVNCSDESM